MSLLGQEGVNVPATGLRVPLSRGARAEQLRPHFQAVQQRLAPPITVFTSFEAAESEWRAFEATASGSAFQSFDWLSAWHRHVGAAAKVQPVIVKVSISGETLLLAPFGIETSLGIRTLVWLGGRFTDYNAPLLAPDFDWRLAKGGFPALWAHIHAALPPHDLIRLENQLPRVGELANPFATLDCMEAPDAAYAFALPRAYEGLVARHRPQTRRMDRQKERQLGELGKVEFLVAETGAEARALASDILDRKAAQLRAQGIRSIFDDMNYRAAYLELAGLEGDERILEVAALYLNDEMISGSIAQVWKGRTTLMVHTYEQAFAKYSPGRLHLLKLMRFSIE